MIDIVEALLSTPLGIFYRVLFIPGTGGMGGGVIVGALALLSLIVVHKRTSSTIPDKLTIGRGWAGLAIVGRIMVSIAALTVGSPWTSYVGALNLVALPFDIASRAVLVNRNRLGLASAYLCNVVPLPPYLIPLSVVAYTLTARSRRSIGEEGILIGRARYALSYVPVELVDRYGDLKNISRDWVQRRLGGEYIYWGAGEEGNPHIFVCGASGMGKSTFMYVLITRLLMEGYPVTVIDPLGQYAKFVRAMEIAREGSDEEIMEFFAINDPEVVRSGWGGARVINVVKSGMNVLEPVAGEPDIVVAEDLSYALSVVERQMLGAIQHYNLTECARTVMEEAAKKGEVPRLSRLAELLEEESKRLQNSKYQRNAESVMNAATRIRLLSRYLEPDGGEPVTPKMLQPRMGEFELGEDGEELVVKWGELVVLDLSGIQDEDTRRITMEFLLRKLRQHIQMRETGRHRRFWYIVIDEAWRLMTRKGDEYRSVINEMIREVRNKGVALALLTQRATDLDKDALANIGTKVYLKLGDEEDIEALVSYTGCHLLREVIPQMDVHEGLILKRTSDLRKVSEATLYRRATDMMFIAELRRIFIPEDLQRTIDEEAKKERLQEWEHIKIVTNSIRNIGNGGSTPEPTRLMPTPVTPTPDGEDRSEAPKSAPSTSRTSSQSGGVIRGEAPKDAAPKPKRSADEQLAKRSGGTGDAAEQGARRGTEAGIPVASNAHSPSPSPSRLPSKGADTRRIPRALKRSRLRKYQRGVV